MPPKKKPARRSTPKKKKKPKITVSDKVCVNEGLIGLMLKNPKEFAPFAFGQGMNLVQVTGDNNLGIYIQASVSIQNGKSKKTTCTSEGNLFIPWTCISGLFIPKPLQDTQNLVDNAPALGFHTEELI